LKAKKIYKNLIDFFKPWNIEEKFISRNNISLQ
jgi:hypothetical protein